MEGGGDEASLYDSDVRVSKDPTPPHATKGAGKKSWSWDSDTNVVTGSAPVCLECGGKASLIKIGQGP